MDNSLELQTLGKRPCENSGKPSRVVSFRTKILTAVIFIVIVCTVMITSIYIIHSSIKVSHGPVTVEVNNEHAKAKLRQLETQIGDIKLAHLLTNLEHEYEHKINQNVSHTLFLEANDLLALHNATKEQILENYDNTEKPSDPEKIKKFRDQLNNKLDKLFIAISHDHSFKRLVNQDWDLSNDTEDQIQKFYNEEYHKGTLSHKRLGLIPPEISLEFHNKVVDLAISKGVALKIIPSSRTVVAELKSFLNSKYYMKTKTNTVYGIDLGEMGVRWFSYRNGIPSERNFLNGYVSVDNNTNTYDAKANMKYGKVLQPIFYDLKQIISDWDSFKPDSDKLFWTFVAQQGKDDEGPLVISPTTGETFTVKTILSKLFQYVHDTTPSSFGKVTKCVISVPHDFDEKRKKLISDAGKLTGFKKIVILDEDIAACLAFEQVTGPWNSPKKFIFIEFNVLSWKFHVLEGFQGDYNRIISRSFNESEDFQQYCVSEFCSLVKCDQNELKKNDSLEARIRWRRLYENCDYPILSLNTENLQPERTKSVYSSWGSGSGRSITIYQTKFEQAFSTKLRAFTQFIDDSLNGANMTKENIEGMLLGGKYGNLWVIRDVFGTYFDGRNMTSKVLSPDQVVGYGAAVKGAMIAGEAIKQGHLNDTFFK